MAKFSFEELDNASFVFTTFLMDILVSYHHKNPIELSSFDALYDYERGVILPPDDQEEIELPEMLTEMLKSKL